MSAVKELAKNEIDNIQEAIDRLKTVGKELKSKRKGSDDTSAYKDAMADAFRLCHETIDFVESDFGGLLSCDRTKLADISARWSFLKTEGRSRLLETNGTWLPGSEVKELERLVAIVTGSHLEDLVSQGSSLRAKLPAHDERLPRHAYFHRFQPFEPWFESLREALGNIKNLYDKSESAARALGEPSKAEPDVDAGPLTTQAPH